MPEIKIVPLGAGQEVGRSCILITIGGKNVMLDCGMHMGFNDERRFPDFSYITQKGKLDDFIDCVIISHFHLDHCGALPYMTEMIGYNGPIYMTIPTKAIVPVLLEDFRKVQVKYRSDSHIFTSNMIKDCMNKVKTVSLHEELMYVLLFYVDNELRIKPYYAGHVLGAAMFEVRVGHESVVYTGDFNMTPDRHLGPAEIDRCRPDVLISESTYATTIRDSKRARERDFLKKVHDCINYGGKVLIPVFALGRAQELCILLESYWERMNLSIPIYVSKGMAEKAVDYYKLFVTWTSEKIKKTFVKRNMFDFKHVLPFEDSFADNPGPMVVFATPGMLHSGQSLKIFKKWASNEKNMVIMPGYCVQGTVGSKLIAGIRKLDLENGTTLDVKLSVEYMSFSAHADSKGIVQLIRNCDPRHVLFVHGEESKMEFLKQKVERMLSIPVLKPRNGQNVAVNTIPSIVIETSQELLKDSLSNFNHPLDPDKFQATLFVDRNLKSIELLRSDEVLKRMEWQPHQVEFIVEVGVCAGGINSLLEQIQKELVERGRFRCNFKSGSTDLIIDNEVILTVYSEKQLRMVFQRGKIVEYLEVGTFLVLFEMPIFTIITNKKTVAKDFHQLLTELLAELLDKPKELVVIDLLLDQKMAFGGSNDPCLIGVLRAVGKISPEENAHYTEKLCKFFHQQLDILQKRMYIRYLNMDGFNVGWNGVLRA
ncbi:Integrator complex subunit 11 [Trichinella papuae]|uniref:Integrator complex subunit 11 n=1 Tax=Trichinella papuae TaxID=268474 RepID=A0A0V1MNL5_9BILA|nr:Integrator complex subunit 11 [Trichinella papuae]